MTEFKRTTQAVDEIETLVQTLLDGSSADLQHLGSLIGSTGATVEKLSRKATETDPARQTYGPQMREKIRSLDERWATVGSLARDVLAQKGGHVVEPSADLAPPPPQPQARRVAVPSEPPASAVSSAPSAPTLSAAERRQRAAAAAEGRAGPAPPAPPAPAAPPAAASPAAAGSGSSRKPLAIVGRMDALMHLVHGVFVGHGFEREENEDRHGIYRLRYVHQQKPPIVVVYVPLQRHLVTYVSLEGSNDPIKATVQIGMPVPAVQAKIDYLLLYPLLYRQNLPTLTSTPPEALFGSICCLSMPAMAALGATCRGMATSVLEDDLVWLRVVMTLPSRQVQDELASLKQREENGEVVPKGAYKIMVRTEVHRLRREAELERRMREEEARARRRAFEDPLRMDPRRPGGFPGSPLIIGGPHDLHPPGFGGRRPNPFGGGGFGGGGFGGGGLGPRFY